ncbi:MAG TPA: 4-hydroxy-tetrahydrodipicolinate reductase [Burkholderiales bacterium]|nr:4-hydroxy-tetrahydrodipicolinate reductase [Burkholderiales bacterium]
MAQIRLAVAGSSGRMGRALIEAVLGASDLSLAAALEQKGNAHVGKDAGELVGAPGGVKVGDDVARAVAGADVFIDFTRPEGTLAHVAACRQQGVNMVIGTTGFGDAQQKEIAAAARDVAIVMSPNFSVGVNVAFRLLEVAARALDRGYDVEIVEAHHRHKVDAPSGTALRMGDVVARALGRDLKRHAVFGREGVTGERKDETIGFATVRGGDLVGDHTVMFIGAGERLEISHRASSRANFARGALRAARFVATKQNGLFDMADVLGFK